MKLANQALFDLLYDEHGLILVESELHEVELVVNKDLQSQLSQLQAENARFKNALRAIANPLAALQKEAEAEGYQLDGAMVLSIARDPEHLKDIAEKAIAGEGV